MLIEASRTKRPVQSRKWLWTLGAVLLGFIVVAITLLATHWRFYRKGYYSSAGSSVRPDGSNAELRPGQDVGIIGAVHGLVEAMGEEVGLEAYRWNLELGEGNAFDGGALMGVDGLVGGEGVGANRSPRAPYSPAGGLRRRRRVSAVLSCGTGANGRVARIEFSVRTSGATEHSRGAFSR